MRFEAYKISEHNWQLYRLCEEPTRRVWLASFNGLNGLLRHYINCHNLSNDNITFKGEALTVEEEKEYEYEKREWHIKEE